MGNNEKGIIKINEKINSLKKKTLQIFKNLPDSFNSKLEEAPERNRKHGYRRTEISSVTIRKKKE